MLFAPGRAFTVGTVEPLLEDVAVAAERMMQGFAESLVIGRSAVVGGVAVPRGDVNAHLDTRLTAGLGEVAQYIALAVAPLAVGDSMSAGRIGPQTETVVVFGSDDNAFHACSLGCGYPLATVEGCGVEDVFGLGSLAPLKAGEGVGAEMAEHVGLHALPAKLSWCRAGAIWCRRLYGGATVQQ